MSGYLLTLLGVIMLGVLINVIIPSGSTNKYISGIFSIFVMCVMISPVLKWINNDYEFSNYFTSSDIQINEQLLNNVTYNKLEALSQDIEKELSDNGYTGVNINIQFKLEAENVIITQVLVDLSNLVINANSTNINKYVYIRQVVLSKLAISEEVVVFSE